MSPSILPKRCKVQRSTLGIMIFVSSFPSFHESSAAHPIVATPPNTLRSSRPFEVSPQTLLAPARALLGQISRHLTSKLASQTCFTMLHQTQAQAQAQAWAGAADATCCSIVLRR
jgi:hypothetical protein